MRRLADIYLYPYAIPALLAWAVVFKGGKTLESTWILTGVVGTLVFLHYYFERKKDRRPISRSLWLPLMLYVGFTWLSFVFSTTQNYGLDEVFQTSALALLFILVVRSDASIRPERIFRIAAIVTVSACFIGLLIYVFQPVNRMTGTFVDPRFTTDYWPNAWAQFLLLMWPIVAFGERNKHPDLEHLLLRAVVLALVFTALLLSYSRGAMIAFVGQLVLGGAYFVIHHRKKFLLRSHLELFGVIAVSVLIMFFTANWLRSQMHPVQSVAEKITFTSAEGTSSIDERRQFWSQAWTLGRERPILGWGPYSFRFIQPKIQTAVLATSDHPHNVFLKYFMERGIVAVVAFIILLAVILFWSGKAFFSKREARSDFTPFVFIAVLGVLAHNLIDYNLQFMGIAIPFWIFLGLLARESVPLLKPLKSSAKIQRTTEIILAGSVLILALIEGRYLIISSLGRHAEANGDVRSALHWYERSRNELFSRDLHLSRAELLLQQRRTPEAWRALDDYYAQNAFDVRYYLLMGQVHEQLSSLTGVQYNARIAYAMSKWNNVNVITNRLRYDVHPETSRIQYLDFYYKFADAIMHNRHFIALSHNVEDLAGYKDLLIQKNLIDARAADEIYDQAKAHAMKERDWSNAQSKGMLW